MFSKSGDNPTKITGNLTSAPFASVSSASTGVTAGIKQGSSALTEGTKLFNADLSDRDSFLNVLEVLSQLPDDLVERDLEVLKMCPAFKDVLFSSINAVRKTVSAAVAGLPITVTHASQLLSDIGVSLTGITHSVDDYNKFTHADASTLRIKNEIENNRNGFSAHCRALINELNNLNNKLSNEIADRFPGGDKDYVDSHKSIAKASASAPFGASVATAATASGIIDAFGAVLREISAAFLTTHQESQRATDKNGEQQRLLPQEGQEGVKAKEQNIYRAFSACLSSMCGSDIHASFRALKELERAILNFDVGSAMANNHSATGVSVSLFTRAVTSEGFVATLRGINMSSIALAIAANEVFKEKQKSTDSIQHSALNASSIKQADLPDAPDSHSHNINLLVQSFKDICQAIDGEINKLADAGKIDLSILGSSAKSTTALSCIVSLIPNLVTACNGMISREVSGVIDFTKNDKGTREQLKQVLKTGPDFGKDLDVLMTRVCALQERLERCKELGVSAPVTLGVSHASSCGALIASLNSVLGMCFALREMRTVCYNPREMTRLDDKEQQDAKIYAASTQAESKKSVGSVGTGSVSDNLSLQDRLLGVVEKAILLGRSINNFIDEHEPGNPRNDLNSVAKSLINLSRDNSTGFLSGALGTLALIGLNTGIGTESLVRAVSLALRHSQRSSDGVDQVRTGNSTRTNLSSASNITRLMEEKSVSSLSSQTTLRTTYVSGEVSFSRSLTVALCHAGVLSTAVGMIDENEEGGPEHFSKSALRSANSMDQLEKEIFQVLQAAEEGVAPMPNLNQDMASQIASSLNVGIVSGLSMHSMISAPILRSFAAAKKGSETLNQDKNAVIPVDSFVSRTVSRCFNTLQAFTMNCKNEFARQSKTLPAAELEKYNSTMQSHFSSNHASASSMFAVCAMTLLLDELMEMSVSRSLTLVDPAKVLLSRLATRDESKAGSVDSTKQVALDSDYGNAASATHSSSALRLTLSHLGETLGVMASKIQDGLSHLEHDFLRGRDEDNNLHTAQRSMLHCMSSAFSQCSLILSQVAGSMSASPVSSVGLIQDLRQAIHALDNELHVKPVESCAKSTRGDNDSRSSVTIGMSSDTVTALTLNALKLLLRGFISVLDSALGVGTLLEIILLHPHPSRALKLQTDAMSMPNGSAANTGHTTAGVSVILSAITNSILENFNEIDDCSNSTEGAMHRMQEALDAVIKQFAMLDDRDTDQGHLNLVRLYEILIRLLAGRNSDASDANCHNLALRFNYGGIRLSSFYSWPGNLHAAPSANNPRENLSSRSNQVKNNLIDSNDEFMGCDDADQLLNLFIREASQNNTLLTELHSALMHKQLTAQASATIDHIQKRVNAKLQLSEIRERNPLHSLLKRREEAAAAVRANNPRARNEFR